MEQIFIKDEPIAGPSSEQDASDVLCTKFEDTAQENSLGELSKHSYCLRLQGISEEVKWQLQFHLSILCSSAC